jgi:hypothetical protein
MNSRRMHLSLSKCIYFLYPSLILPKTSHVHLETSSSRNVQARLIGYSLCSLSLMAKIDFVVSSVYFEGEGDDYRQEYLCIQKNVIECRLSTERVVDCLVYNATF